MRPCARIGVFALAFFPAFSQVVIRDSVRIGSATLPSSHRRVNYRAHSALMKSAGSAVSSKTLSLTAEGFCRNYSWSYHAPLATVGILSEDNVFFEVEEGDPRRHEDDDEFVEGDSAFWTGVHYSIRGNQAEFYLMDETPPMSEEELGRCPNPDYVPGIPNPYWYGTCPAAGEPVAFNALCYNNPEWNPLIPCCGVWLPNEPEIVDIGFDYSDCTFGMPEIEELSPYSHRIRWPSRGVAVWVYSRITLAMTQEPDTVAHADTSRISFRFEDGNGGTVAMPEDLPVMFNLFGPKSYGALVSPDGSPETTLELSAGWMKDHALAFAANGIEPDSVAWMGLRAYGPSNGNQNILGYTGIAVRKVGPLRLVVEFSKDTLSHGDSALVKVRAVDGSGVETAPGPGTGLRFILDAEAARYGGLRRSDRTPLLPGDRVSFSDANGGLIQYHADGGEPNGRRPIRCLVMNAADTVNQATGEAVVRDSIEFTITIPEPKEIWPTLPGGNFSGRNVNRNNIRENIFIEVLKNSLPLGDQSVTTNVEIRLPSGGHDHTVPPPNTVMGTLAAASDGSANGMLAATTNQDGAISINYTAPMFGGVFDFGAKTVINGDTVRASDSLVVRVPGIELLADHANYIKVGGTCGHHGPSDAGIPANCETPDHNHWGTQALRTAILSIATAYDSIFPGVRLRINDMSLEYGGLFDSERDWEYVPDVSHLEHRTGKQVDISDIAANQGHMVNVDFDVITMLIQKKCRRDRGFIYHNHHYHVRAP